MNKNIYIIIGTILIIIFGSYSSVFSLMVQTHEAINMTIAQGTMNGFSLDSYLKNNLGMSGGVEELFNNTTAYDMVSVGGRYEDLPPRVWWNPSTWPPYVRSGNHFHNPLTDTGYGIWDSAIRWSQRDPGNQFPGGYYSWHDVRNYFYTALTGKDKDGNIVAPTKAERDNYFADTFRGLGQLMHLVQDMSVPEHSRNDGHVFYCYEDWVKEAQLGVNGKAQWKYIYDNALSTPIFFNKDALVLASNFADAAVPIANLFDNQQYNNGSNPDVTLLDNIGLSEFSNANFLSPDTMFSTGFLYPNWSNIVESNPTNSLTGEKTTYLTKLGMGETVGGQTGNGVHVEHLAAVRWPYKYLPTSVKQYGLSLNDDQVYADYAKLLLTRAVGYSAQLLNYFFRGQIEAVNPDITATGGSFKIKNNTPNEAIATDKPGKFVVSYQYTEPGSNPPVYNYGVSNEVALAESIPSGAESATEYTFTFPGGGIPSDAQEIKYLLVFRGKLGNEEDAVAANMIPPWYGYYDGSDNVDRYFWSSKTKTWNVVPLNAFSTNEIGKRLAIGRNGAVVVAEAGYSNYSEIKIAASHDYGVTWQTTSVTPAVGNESFPAVDVSEDGVFWLGVGVAQGNYGNEHFVVYIYRSEDGLSWVLKGAASVAESNTALYTDDFDIAATKKDDGTTDVYVTCSVRNAYQTIGKFVNGSAYSPVSVYAPGVEIDDYQRIEANKTDWFLLTTASLSPTEYWPAERILKNGSVVLATNNLVNMSFMPWTGDIRYSNGRLVAVGTGWYVPIFALSLDGGNSWSQPASPAGFGSYGSDRYSVDIQNDKIIYSVTSADYNAKSFFYKIYEGTINAQGTIIWTLVDSGIPPFINLNTPPGHIRFGIW